MSHLKLCLFQLFLVIPAVLYWVGWLSYSGLQAGKKEREGQDGVDWWGQWE